MADSDTDRNLSFYGFGPENVVFCREIAHMSDAVSEQSDLSISEVSTSELLMTILRKLWRKLTDAQGIRGTTFSPHHLPQ